MEKKIKVVKLFARLLDDQFEIGGVRFGIDPILDIIPWFGDAAGALLSLYLLYLAKSVKVTKVDFSKMLGNIFVDAILGVIPFLGVVFDVIWKANTRNIKILEKYSHGKFIEGEIVS